MNTLLHAVYDDPRQAEQATQQLRALEIVEGAILSVTSAMASSAAGRAHMGSFADSGAHMHDAERDHVGSFADSAPAARDATLAEDLVRAGLSQADARAAAARLGTGATLVLARAEGEAATRAAAILQSVR
jgi:hypothetical protein